MALFPLCTVSPKCCYFHRGNTKSGFKIISHILSQKKEVGSLTTSRLTLCSCPNLMMPQRPAPGTAMACPWNVQAPASNFLMHIYGDLLATRHVYRCVHALNWAWWGKTLGPGSKLLKWQKCPHCLCQWNVPDPHPTEAHDILSVLEMTEDTSLWDSRASAGIFTPFAMLTWSNSWVEESW